MTETVLLQQVVNAIALGSIYAMIAVGLAMIYGVLRILHIAHAAVFTAGAYIGLFFYHVVGSFVLALPLAMLSAGVLGCLIERFVYRPMLGRPRIVALIGSIGVFICLTDLFRIVAGPDQLGFNVRSLAVRYSFDGISLSGVDATILAGTATIFLVLWLLLQKTKIGLGIRAAAQDIDTAKTMGIDVHGSVQKVFFIGSAIAAFGGVMVAVLYNAVYTNMGDMVAYKGLALIVIGGFGSTAGAVLAAFLLGLSETVITTYTTIPLSRDGIAMLLLVILVLIRPNGLLSKR